MKNYISFPRTQGISSRQAHADLPEGTFERELGKEGFFGPATHMYHKNPPTGWVDWEGPLRPRAFDLNRINREDASPWDATEPALQRAHPHALLAGAGKDGSPGSQCRRRRVDLRPSWPWRAVLRLRASELPRRRLYHAAAFDHVADRMRRAGAGAADRGDQFQLHAAGQGHSGPSCDLRSRGARHPRD